MMAGVQGFEPQNGGIKTRCLTAWLHPCSNSVAQCVRCDDHTATKLNGRGAGIRTPEWRDQNPLPYRLATPLQQTAEILLAMVRKKRLELLRLAALEPKSSASTNFATSANLDNLRYLTSIKWWLQRESNLRPQHYECCALTS